MPLYFWKGIDTQGTVQKGTLYENSVEQLREALLNQGIALLSHRKVFTIRSWLKIIFPQQVSDEQRILFFEHMASLVNHGVPVMQALQLFCTQGERGIFKEALDCIIGNVGSGISLADAFAQEPLIFNVFLVQLVASGERSGKLGFVFEKITTYLRDKQLIKKEMVKAAALPLMTLACAFMLVIGIFIFVIPHFEIIFATLEKPLPNSTRFIITFSQFLRSTWGFLVLLSVPSLIMIIKRMVKIPRMSVLKDRACFFFIIKKWYVNSVLIHFLQILSMFLKSGIPLKQALEGAHKTLHNTFIKEEIKGVIESVSQGNEFAVALKQTHSFMMPEKIISLIKIGEESGQLVNMLDQAVILMQADLKNRLHMMLTLLQPILLLVVGIFIAFIMVSIYLPIFTLAISF